MSSSQSSGDFWRRFLAASQGREQVPDRETEAPADLGKPVTAACLDILGAVLAHALAPG
ncbi:MAG: hypothetical protein WB767_03265 [Nocardioides sp.]